MTRNSFYPRIKIPCFAVVLTAALTTFPCGGATAQDWQTTDCATSQLQIDGQTRCLRRELVVGSTGHDKLSGSWFASIGRLGQLTFSTTFVPPPPNQGPAWSAYSAQVSERIIRNNAGTAAVEFGSYRGFDHTGFMEFRKGQSNCVGIDHGYPSGSSYAFYIRGEICSTSTLDDPERLVRELMAAVQIRRPGEAQAINGFGVTPVALPWKAPAAPPVSSPTSPTRPAAPPAAAPAPSWTAPPAAGL